MNKDNILAEIKRREAQKKKSEAVKSQVKEVFSIRYDITPSRSDVVRRGEVHTFIVSKINLTTYHSNIRVIKEALEEMGVKERVITGKRYYCNVKEKDDEN